LVRCGQAEAARGVPIGGLRCGSGRHRIEARPDRDPPGRFNVRPVHVVRRRGECSRDGQRRAARPINTRRVVGEPLTGGPHTAVLFQNKINLNSVFHPKKIGRQFRKIRENLWA
jgi:hypothetical protein